MPDRESAAIRAFASRCTAAFARIMGNAMSFTSSGASENGRPGGEDQAHIQRLYADRKEHRSAGSDKFALFPDVDGAAGQAGAEADHGPAGQACDHGGSEVTDVDGGAQYIDPALRPVDGDRTEDEEEDQPVFEGRAPLEDGGERCRSGDGVGDHHDDADHLEEDEGDARDGGCHTKAPETRPAGSGFRTEASVQKLLSAAVSSSYNGKDPVKPRQW